MELKIEIAQRVSDNFGEPINYLSQYVKSINENPAATRILFDFKKCKFSSPFILAGLAGLIFHLKQSGKEVVLSEENSFQSYLDTIMFPDGYPSPLLSLAEIESNLKPYHDKTFIPVVAFPVSNVAENSQVREKTLSAINSILKQQLNLQGNVLEGIYYLISELTQNVSDHSNGTKGFLFAQYYPSKNYMDLSIVDTGRGLLQSYIDTGNYTITTDEEAIKLALSGKSTKDINSRGYGIPTSRKLLVKGLKGKFFLWSGNALINHNAEKEEIIHLPEHFNWQGCYVALRIPIFNNEQFSIYNFLE